MIRTFYFSSNNREDHNYYIIGTDKQIYSCEAGEFIEGRIYVQ